MGARKIIFDALAAAGIPAAEDHFRADALGAKGTHAVVRHEGTSTLFSGGRPRAVVDEWSVTLYSPERDEEAEKALIGALGRADLPIGGSSSGYDDEHLVHWREWDFQTIGELEWHDN